MVTVKMCIKFVVFFMTLLMFLVGYVLDILNAASTHTKEIGHYNATETSKTLPDRV